MTGTGSIRQTAESEGNSANFFGNVFYGWWMVVAGIAILFVSSGVGFYCHGVILDPLRTQYGWSKGVVSSAITIYFVVTGITGFLIGKQVDKYGPKPILIIGSLIFGLSFAMLGFIQEIWQLYLFYFLAAVGWTGTSLLPVNTLITKWFIRKRGFAMSLTMTGLSVGGMVMVPLCAFLIQGWGLKVALPVLGAAFWFIIIPIAVFFIKKQPSDVNQHPDGDLIDEPPPTEHSEVSLSYDTQTQIWTRGQAVKTIAFWSIVVAFSLALGGQVAFMMHQVSFLSQYLGVNGAATAVGVTAAASILGRLILGIFVDRIDKRYAFVACCLAQGATVLMLAYNQHTAILYLGTFTFGLTMGSLLMMQSLIVGECFGMVSFATVSGLSGVFGSTGAAFGPMIAGFIFDVTQSYKDAFTIFALASAVAAVVIVFAKPPQHPSSENQATNTLS